MTKSRASTSKNAENKLTGIKIVERHRTARALIRALVWVALFYFMAQSVRELAGKDTSLFVKGTLAFFADIKFVATLALAGCAAGWAFAERALRHRKVEYLQDRIKQLELRIDPNRTTSGLTPAGKTHPRDREV